VGVGERGGDEVDEDAVDPLLFLEHLHRGAEPIATGGSHHVDRVLEGSLGKLGFRKPGDRFFGEPRHFEPGGHEDVGGDDGRPAGVRDDPDPVSRRDGLGGEAFAARTISSSFWKERMPVFSKISSVAMSTPASDPVWDEAALAPCSVRPAFMASTGFRTATPRAVSRNSRGSENPSV
jgi:hypothetical protein